MTDKVQKIREEVVRIHKLLPVMDGDNIPVNYADRICTTLEMYIDSLQKEPVNESVDFEQELYKAFGQVKDFTLGVRIAKRFYDMGKKSREPVNKQNLSNVERTGKDWKEEPVSEDLEKAYLEWYNSVKYKSDLSGTPINAFKAGAQWQKEQIIVNTADATIGLPYENKHGGYTHLVDVSRPLPVGNNKIAIIFKED